MNSQNSTNGKPMTKPVEVLMPDKSIVHGIFLLWNKDPGNPKFVRLTLQYLNKELSASGASSFHALTEIRLELERGRMLLKCYGASRNVWPSGMGISAGKAYKQFFGKKGDIKDVVSIFDSGPDVDPCSFEEQRHFHNEWLASLGIDPNREVYPWKLLFASSPFKTTALFFNKRILKRGKKTAYAKP